MTKHFAIVGILVVIVTIAVSTGLDMIGLLPEAASAQAGTIDYLFDLHIKIISFLFALIVVFMGYSIVVFRRKKGETGDGDHFEGHTGLEIAWTILPLGTVLYFAYLGAQTLADVRRADPNAMEVEVIASQWAWQFKYPQYDISSDALHLPVNQQVVLKITSVDVLHSFWVPEFRVKQDAVPGSQFVKELRVTPSLIGQYKVRCAELCGTQHAYMENPVEVMSAEGFQQWLAENQPPDNPVARGQKWSKELGCTACHAISTEVGQPTVGPSWVGLYGKEETLVDGTKVLVDDAYLHTSIVDPNAQIVTNFNANIMPQNFSERMEEGQIADIIEYIKTLK
jgi:cytochrome c oxidase subunit II